MKESQFMDLLLKACVPSYLTVQMVNLHKNQVVDLILLCNNLGTAFLLPKAKRFGFQSEF